MEVYKKGVEYDALQEIIEYKIIPFTSKLKNFFDKQKHLQIKIQHIIWKISPKIN